MGSSGAATASRWIRRNCSRGVTPTWPSRPLRPPTTCEAAVPRRSGQVIARTVVAGIEQFRRIVDEAHEGDNVGLLVRDLAADSVRAGDVLRS